MKRALKETRLRSSSMLQSLGHPSELQNSRTRLKVKMWFTAPLSQPHLWARGAGTGGWKCGGKDAPKIIAASSMPNKAKPFPRFLPLNRGASSAITPLCIFQQAANSAATPLHTSNKLLFLLPNHFQQTANCAATPL
jgi:hypothetical protein